MKKWLDLFNKGTQIRNQEFIPTESEIDNEVTLTVKYDEWLKQPYMNKEQQELLDEAYKNYTQTKVIKTENGETHISPQGHYSNLSQEEFINKCKTDLEFSEKWGLKIEERELSLEERGDIYETNFKGLKRNKSNEDFDKINIPTKLITITYNDKTIESYE
jgi:hypothetical protein